MCRRDRWTECGEAREGGSREVDIRAGFGSAWSSQKLEHVLCPRRDRCDAVKPGFAADLRRQKPGQSCLANTGCTPGHDREEPHEAVIRGKRGFESIGGVVADVVDDVQGMRLLCRA